VRKRPLAARIVGERGDIVELFAVLQRPELAVRIVAGPDRGGSHLRQSGGEGIMD
jgi:hypothetical protein